MYVPFLCGAHSSDTHAIIRPRARVTHWGWMTRDRPTALPPSAAHTQRVCGGAHRFSLLLLWFGQGSKACLVLPTPRGKIRLKVRSAGHCRELPRFCQSHCARLTPSSNLWLLAVYARVNGLLRKGAHPLRVGIGLARLGQLREAREVNHPRRGDGRSPPAAKLSSKLPD